MDVLCGIDGSRTAGDALRLVRASFAFGGDMTVEVLLGEHNPAAELLARAEETRPEILVLAADMDDPTAQTRLAHSASRVVARAALEGHSSVLVCASPGAIHRVVVATDGSREAERAIQLFLQLPFREAPDVVVVSVIDPASRDGHSGAPGTGSASRESAMVAHAIAAEAAAEVRPAAARVEFRTPVGAPADQIAVVAAEVGADLIVVGTRGLSAQQRRRVGSVTAALLERMPASLLVARAEPA